MRVTVGLLVLLEWPVGGPADCSARVSPRGSEGRWQSTRRSSRLNAFSAHWLWLALVSGPDSLYPCDAIRTMSAQITQHIGESGSSRFAGC